MAGLVHQGRPGQPPGGAVGEGKRSVIKQAAAKTPRVPGVYEAVTSSYPPTMKEETPFFYRHSTLVFKMSSLLLKLPLNLE